MQHERSARGLGGCGVVVHVIGNSGEQVKATDKPAALVYQSGSVLSVGCKNSRLLVEVIKQIYNSVKIALRHAIIVIAVRWYITVFLITISTVILIYVFVYLELMKKYFNVW